MNAEQSVLAYFNYKHIENLKFLKYGYFKRLISYILDIHNTYLIRKIFLSLVEQDYFIKLKNIKKSYIYMFNPTGKINNKKEIIIDPNRFIITWT